MEEIPKVVTSASQDSLTHKSPQHPSNPATTAQVLTENHAVPPTQDLLEENSTDMFDNYDWSMVFQDEQFEDFLDGFALTNSAHAFGNHTSLGFPELGDPAQSYTPSQLLERHSPRIQGEADAVGDLSRFGSRLPSLEPEDYLPNQRSKNDPTECCSPWASTNPGRCLLEVTAECRKNVMTKLAEYANVIPEHFILPSRHALNRFVEMYIGGFNKHNPVIHLPTLVLDSIVVELFLSIVALGARYCREVQTSLDLFRVAKAIAFERIRRWDNSTTFDLFTAKTSTILNFPEPQAQSMGIEESDDCAQIELMQALILMMGSSIWFGRTPAAHSREVASIRSTLELMIRELALDAVKGRHGRSWESWESWVKLETFKRIILVSFCLFNLLTILHDIAPTLFCTEMELDLPCTEEIWNAKSSALWRQASERGTTEATVQDTMRSLFQSDTERYRPSFSSLGGYFLIHAILQFMWILQQTSPLRVSKEFAPQSQDFMLIQQALRHWRRGWEHNPESSMNPIHPSGPIAFTSTALLRLAYVRMNVTTRLIPALNTWDPKKIAQSFIEAPPIERSDRTTRAALHCAHALSIPVKIGVNFVRHTQGFYWSNQHALCSLECAFFLSKWLDAVTTPHLRPPMSEKEALLLDFVVQIVVETEFRAPREALLETHGQLSKIVVRLWARLFPENSVWEIVGLVGRSITACADALESE